jgi:uncharacterized protein
MPEIGTTPLPASERIVTLDIVRGFALLGIIIMNMPGFGTSFFAESDGRHLWTAGYDLAAESIRDALFAGKFNSMFSLLFGVGFTIQLGRLLERDPDRAISIYVRRLLVLLAMGLVHAMVFWNGDVLHIYAILGFGLLLLRNVSDRFVFVLIGCCILYPAVSGLLRLWLMTPDIVAARVAEGLAFAASNDLAYGTGTFVEAAREHVRETIYFYGSWWSLWGTFGFYVLMTTTMLIGFLIGRNNVMRRIPEFLPVIKRMQWWALGIGVGCGAAFGTIFFLNRVPGPSPIKIAGSILFVISRLALMMFYVFVIVRLAQLPAWKQRFAPIAATGRMPLTNYLMQTLIATTIFNGWGFGLWGKVGPAAGLLLAFAIYFVIQVPLSVWWLRRYELGPMEWLWRYCTYGRRPSMRPDVRRATA